MSVGADDGGVDHQPFEVRIGGDRLEHAVEHAHLDPAIVAPLGRLIGAEPLRQVTPAPAGPRHPQQGVEEAPPVAARAALALAAARNERLHLLPLIVPQNLAVHRRPPKVSVESDLQSGGKPRILRKTLATYLLQIAMLGGYRARNHDPPPGNMVVWRGLTRLNDIVFGLSIGTRRRCR